MGTISMICQSLPITEDYMFASHLLPIAEMIVRYHFDALPALFPTLP